MARWRPTQGRWSVATVVAVPLLVLFLVVAFSVLLGIGFDTAPSSAAQVETQEVEYSPVRAIVGVALSFGLLAAAVWVVRSTDWERPEGDPFVDPPESEARSGDA